MSASALANRYARRGMGAEEPVLRVLDSRQREALERLCELIVPGSTEVGPAVYVDALLAGMPVGAREHVLGSIEELGEVARGGAQALAPHAHSPAFLGVRALVIEAYYSDFVASGRDAPGAWAQIGFDPPAAAHLRKDWSYLGIAR
jgi:hypothetical protein